MKISIDIEVWWNVYDWFTNRRRHADGSDTDFTVHTYKVGSKFEENEILSFDDGSFTASTSTEPEGSQIILTSKYVPTTT